MLIRQNLFGVYRDIFDFSIESGLRISDILKLKAHKIAREITIRESKTKKYKTIVLSEGLFSRLKRLQTGNTAVYAFASPRTVYKPLHRSTYHLALKRASRVTNVNVSAHSARKLHAQNIFELSSDIFEVQKAMNHKYITDTCRYLDIDLRKLVNEAKGARDVAPDIRRDT